MKSNVCSFFGHRKIEMTEDLKQKIKGIIEDMIVNNNVRTFLFGSRSEFDNLCHLLVTELKEKYQIMQQRYCVILTSKRVRRWLFVQLLL